MASEEKKSGQMKKISRFYIGNLHLEEDFGFHCQVVALTEKLPLEGMPKSSLLHLQGLSDNYRAAVTRLDDALSADTLSPISRKVVAANKERSLAWRGLKNFAKAMRACPQAAMATAASVAAAVIDKYGNPTYLSQLQGSAVIHNLLQDLRTALAAGDLEGLGIEVWLDDLEAKERAYLEADNKRTAGVAARRAGEVQQARRAADAAYRNLAEGVDFLALLYGDALFAGFIPQLNVMVAEEREVLKGRATRRENRDAREA